MNLLDQSRADYRQGQMRREIGILCGFSGMSGGFAPLSPSIPTTKRNFDDLNAVRRRRVDDETKKLLILAKDLNAKSRRLVRIDASRLLVRGPRSSSCLKTSGKRLNLTVDPE
jgi:hypothetical protein